MTAGNLLVGLRAEKLRLGFWELLFMERHKSSSRVAKTIVGDTKAYDVRCLDRIFCSCTPLIV